MIVILGEVDRTKMLDDDLSAFRILGAGLAPDKYDTEHYCSQRSPSNRLEADTFSFSVTLFCLLTITIVCLVATNPPLTHQVL